MTATAGTGTTRGGRRGLVVAAAVAAVIVVAALVAGQGSSDGGASLSPTSTSADGLRGFVLLVEQFGGTVTTGSAVPPADAGVALLTADHLDGPTRDRIAQWVEQGGTLVVTDPASSLSAFDSETNPTAVVARGVCTSARFDGVDRLDVSAPSGTDLDPSGGVRFEVSPSGPSCFGDDRAAYVVETSRGRGHVVSVGSPNPLVNGRLGHLDNSVFAIRLAQPNGPTALAVLDAHAAGGTSLLDLVPDRVFQAILQVGIAYLLYVLYRVRRLGRPVLEPQPVEIPGSQMVRAVGHLQSRSRAADQAARAVRADVRRTIGQHYGLPAHAPPETVAGAVAARTGVAPDIAARALADTPVQDDDELVAVTHDLDTIRTEVLHGSRR